MLDASHYTVCSTFFVEEAEFDDRRREPIWQTGPMQAAFEFSGHKVHVSDLAFERPGKYRRLLVEGERLWAGEFDDLPGEPGICESDYGDLGNVSEIDH